MKLAIITTHPIQYYAPVFKLLAKREKVAVKVFYTWGKGALNKFDPGFEKVIKWDIPLLEGYDYEWMANSSKNPGSHKFSGIVNPDLIDRINGWNADAILVFGWAYQAHLKAIRYFHGRRPVFFRGDSTLLDEKGYIRSFIKKTFLSWVYRHIDHAFYVGSLNHAYFNSYGLADKQLSFAPHAVDNERFAVQNTGAVEALRKNLGLGENDVLILFAGKLEEKKAPEELLKAFLLLENRSWIHLLFVGNGRLEEHLKRLAAGEPNIHFLDFQNQSKMPAIYQACDLFCLPSNGPGETWGLAVNEAMACGKAVLVSDKAGCFADLVIDNNNGKVFESGNEKQLVQYLKELTGSRAGLSILGANSVNRIRSWNFTAMAEAIEEKLTCLRKNDD
ncbi:glycosyltransferase family 4 protein [Mucilaginibacter sp. BJC16-A38]|uniref:glycosyltransferase family 4 protein n=1 Tax=Mucilaginibacter phenanthrenivorans TaxID=1234842 RepID=UPI002158143E|nr:glycosyltransferase family 4 protein [Mucilaginibacter phenanthrenivorans]MCR8560172.1 glycosyltransferase family 4 protein [Mucilaginibacter phenanthrenivorans]